MIHYVLFAEIDNSLFHTPIRNVDDIPQFLIEDLTRSSGSVERIIASGNAITSSVSVETDVDAGPSKAVPNKIPVLTTNGFSIGDKCFITHPDGFGEQFTIEGLQLQDYLLADQPLMDEYPCLSTVAIIEISAAFPDATAQQEETVDENRPYRVVWEYTIEGKKTKVQEQVRVVRNDGTDMNLSEAMRLIRKGFADISERMPTGTTLREWVEFSLEDLQANLLSKGRDPKSLLTGKQGTQALVWRTLCHAAENGSAPGNMDPGVYLENCQKRLSAIWNGLYIGTVGPETGELNKRTDSVPANRTLSAKSPFQGL